MFSDLNNSSNEKGDDKLLEKIEPEVIEAWNMWIYKSHGIMPNQYHYAYEQGDTLIYPEHIQDLMTIDKIWANKLSKEQHRQKAKAPKNNPLAKQKGGLGSFYGQTYKYNNNS